MFPNVNGLPVEKGEPERDIVVPLLLSSNNRKSKLDR